MKYIEGSVPILVVIPHSRVLRTRFREDMFARYREQEPGLDKLAMAIREYLPVHVLINEDEYVDLEDASSRDHPFRQKIEELKHDKNIMFILDLHGMGDEGYLHMQERVVSGSLDPALGYAVSKYTRRWGIRPDVDLEFRRRARTLSTTCIGSIVYLFKEELLNMGFIVGIESVYPGGDIIGYHSYNSYTMALAMEIARRVRDNNNKLHNLAIAICRALTKIFRLEPIRSLEYDVVQIPSVEDMEREDEESSRSSFVR